MYRTIAITGATAAAIVGVGTAALATTGSDTSGSATTASTTSSTSSATDAAKAGKLAKRHGLLERALAHHLVHGQVVTKDGSTYVTHDSILGTVTAVSPTSISVKASDGFPETFTITSATKVRLRTNGKGSPSTIGSVHSGDTVAVAGTGSPTPTARIVVDVQGS